MVSLFQTLEKEKMKISISSREQDYGTLYSIRSSDSMVSNSQDLNVKTEANFSLRKCFLICMVALLVFGCFANGLVFCFKILSQQRQKVCFTTELEFKTKQELKTESEFTTEPDDTTETSTEQKLSTQFSTCFPTCTTKWCNIYSQILNSTMDKSVDPCEDFYEHVCANWNPSVPRMSYLTLQLENTHDIIQYALEDRNASSLLLQSKSKLVQYMAHLYQDWVDMPKRKQPNMETLLRQLLGDAQLLSLFGSSSKIFHSNANDSESDFKLLNSTDAELLMDCFVEASLVGIDTFFKPIQISNKEIYISFNEEVYKRNDDFRHERFEKLKKKISKFFRIKNAQWKTSFNSVLFEIIDFELKLAEMLENFKIEPDIQQILYLPDFLELSDNSTAFNWTLLLGKFANKTGTSTQFLVDKNVKVITQNFQLLDAITELILSTPIRVLKNVMTCHYIDALKSLKSKELLFIEKRSSNAPSEMVRLMSWHEFVSKDFELFLPLYTRLFVDYVGREKMNVARDQANEMMQNMKRLFGKSLKQEHNWLDEQTRVKALEKVNAMEAMISHPDWILDDTALDEEFGFENIGENYSPIKGNFVESYFNLLRIVQSANFKKLDRNETKHNQRKFDFTFDGIGVNYPNSNHISITHALLLDPSFNVDYPIGLNYAHLGTTISHELIHGFDNDGIKYDKVGGEVNWWTDDDAREYEDRSQCFVRQYDSMSIWSHGTLTLAENIADNGGLNLAYRIFEKHLAHSQSHCNSSSQTLPPFLAQYSDEQQFFLSYGLRNCAHRGYSSNWDGDVHSPKKYRVNIPVQNSDQFAKAFKCPVGSKMNPEKKCLLW